MKTLMTDSGGLQLRLLAIFLFVLCAGGRLLAQTTVPSTTPTDGSAKTPAETRIDDLERQLHELKARVAELEGGEEPHKPVGTTGTDGREPTVPAAQAQAPKSDEASTTSQTGPISGYMDFHLNRPEN
jgi:hypothetical protein